MKKLFIILTLIFVTNSYADLNNAPRRSNGLLRFLASSEGLRNTALATILSARCNRYLKESEKKPCRDAVAKKVLLLDFDIIISDDKSNPVPRESWNPKSFVFVAFKKDLISLLSDKKTTDFLNDLQERLTKYLIGENTDLNVWDAAIFHYKSHFLASKVMAVLFQDTSMMKLHLAYLDRANIRGTMAFSSNKVLLSRVIDTVNLVLDYNSEDIYQDLFYPRFLKEDLNRNIYHFYVPLYLAGSLERIGVSKRYAYIAPFLLTLSYEFITSSNDYRYIFKDPEQLDPSRNHGKLQDIFGGYCGSSFGVKGSRFYRSFDGMKEGFARSTQDTVEFLLNL